MVIYIGWFNKLCGKNNFRFINENGGGGRKWWDLVYKKNVLSN